MAERLKAERLKLKRKQNRFDIDEEELSDEELTPNGEPRSSFRQNSGSPVTSNNMSRSVSFAVDSKEGSGDQKNLSSSGKDQIKKDDTQVFRSMGSFSSGGHSAGSFRQQLQQQQNSTGSGIRLTVSSASPKARRRSTIVVTDGQGSSQKITTGEKKGSTENSEGSQYGGLEDDTALLGPSFQEAGFEIQTADALEREKVLALLDDSFLTWRLRWFFILEGQPHAKDQILFIIFNVILFIVVLGSVAIFCVQSYPEFTNRAETVGRTNDGLFWAETACIVVFVFEALLRVWCVPLSHLFNVFFVIDVVTILGYVADLFLESSVSFLSSLRLLRIFRIFKLSRYSKSLQLVLTVLRTSSTALTMLLLPLILVAVTAATLIYFFEILEARWDSERRLWMNSATNHPQEFQSIPDALWFTFTTIATVGYGDFVPQSLGGRFIAVGLQLIGVLTLSFPNIVLGANLQVAFKNHKTAIARAYLRRKFRLVMLVLAFIRRMQYLTQLKEALEAAELEEEGSSIDYNNEEQQDDVETKRSTNDSDDDIFSPTKREGSGFFRALGEGGNAKAAWAESFDVPDDSQQGADGILITQPTIQPKHSARSSQHSGYMSTQPESSMRSLVDRNASGRRATMKNRELNNFFMLSPSDVACYQKNDIQKLDKFNVRSWAFKGVTAIQVLQVMLEGFSGVATVEEIFDALPLQRIAEQNTSPGSPLSSGGGSATVRMKDIGLIVMFLAEAQLVQVFVLRRNTTKMVASLMDLAISELLLHPENATYPCLRSAELARFTWKQTTGKLVAFQLSPVFNHYENWSTKEKYADPGGVPPDLKLTLELTPGEVSEITRLCSTADGRARFPMHAEAAKRIKKNALSAQAQQGLSRKFSDSNFLVNLQNNQGASANPGTPTAPGTSSTSGQLYRRNSIQDLSGWQRAAMNDERVLMPEMKRMIEEQEQIIEKLQEALKKRGEGGDR